MNKTQARALLGETVYYLPQELPTAITWQTPIPSGTLDEVAEKIRKEVNSIVTRNWCVVAGNTRILGEIYATIDDAKTALKRRYRDEVIALRDAATSFADLVDAVGTIGIDPNPPVEPEEEPE